MSAVYDPAPPGPVLVVTEGKHDIEFLKRISRMLHGHDARVPHLGTLEAEGKLLFLPGGGGDLNAWATRFAALPHPRFFLFDRETAAVRAERQALVEALNRKPWCAAFLTSLRAAENYLHPSAILAATGVHVAVGDDDDVARLLALKVLELTSGQPWESLSRRARTRLCNQIKRVLNTTVVEHMTPGLLAERDPRGEVHHWLMTIGAFCTP